MLKRRTAKSAALAILALRLAHLGAATKAGILDALSLPWRNSITHIDVIAGTARSGRRRGLLTG